jgi:hypothetical protein
MVNTLPMYMVYDYDPTEGALLVFAPNRQEARVLASRDGWLGDARFIDIRARRIPDGPATAHLRAAATSEGPHVVDSPPSCDACGTWGALTAEGGCSTCASEAEWAGCV